MVHSLNEASQRLHESLGFTLEGRLRRMMYTDGAFHDALIDGLTREECDAQKLDTSPAS
jgi:RimJ/RimL family protein N-acetyltransferase